MFYAVLLFATVSVVFVIGRLNRRRRLRFKSVPFIRTHSDVENDPEKITAVVTGGCGCLGREIIRQLIATDRYAVHCLDIFIPPEDKRIAGVVSYIQMDIANFSDVSRALQGMEVVFHTASLMPVSILNTPEAMEQVNVKGTRNVVQACKQGGVKRLIYTSSGSVLLSKDSSRNVELMDEFSPFPDRPLNAYVCTKGKAEIIVREATSENGLRTCALRLGAILGRGNVSTVSHVQNKPMFGSGDFIFGWTSVKSAGEVHLLAERYLAKKFVSASKNVFNVISTNSKYKDVKCCFSMQIARKEPARISVRLTRALIVINELAFWFTGLTPLGVKLYDGMADILIPNSYSTEYTKKELGWEDKRTLEQIVSDCITEHVY